MDQPSNNHPSSQTLPIKPAETHGPNKADSIHARLRRLELRIAQLELKASVVRRDVDRVEKRQYAGTKSPSDKYLPGPGPDNVITAEAGKRDSAQDPFSGLFA